MRQARVSLSLGGLAEVTAGDVRHSYLGHKLVMVAIVNRIFD